MFFVEEAVMTLRLLCEVTVQWSNFDLEESSRIPRCLAPLWKSVQGLGVMVLKKREHPKALNFKSARSAPRLVKIELLLILHHKEILGFYKRQCESGFVNIIYTFFFFLPSCHQLCAFVRLISGVEVFHNSWKDSFLPKFYLNGLKIISLVIKLLSRVCARRCPVRHWNRNPSWCGASFR